MFVRTLRATRAFRAPVRFVSTIDKAPANDPVERAAKPNVSETNVTPTSSEGSFDKVLQEDVADAERMRAQQSPNYKGIWSRSQQPREVAMSGPRFEQSIIEDQVCLF
jgi:NADH dehydrogenase (ubiquinone) Fe-S protein 6